MRAASPSAPCDRRTRSRYDVQCALEDQPAHWSDAAFLGRTACAPRSLDGGGGDDGSVDREIHRAAAQLRRRTDAVRPPFRRRRRAYHSTDRRQGLNLAASDVRYLSQALIEHYRDKSEAGLDAYSARALTRVWSAVRFSWWMTSMLHRFDGRERLRHADTAGRVRPSRRFAPGRRVVRRELRRAALLKLRAPRIVAQLVRPSGTGSRCAGVLQQKLARNRTRGVYKHGPLVGWSAFVIHRRAVRWAALAARGSATSNTQNFATRTLAGAAALAGANS